MNSPTEKQIAFMEKNPDYAKEAMMEVMLEEMLKEWESQMTKEQAAKVIGKMIEKINYDKHLEQIEYEANLPDVMDIY